MLNSATNFWAHYIPTIGGVPNPGLEAGRLAIRLFCNREPPSNFQNVPFQGGQCNVNYIVYANVNYHNQNGVNTATFNFNARYGKIKRVYFQFPTARSWRIYFDHGALGDPDGLYTTQMAGGSSTIDIQTGLCTINSVWVSRVDGQPDNCGDPPIVRPPSPSSTYNDYSTTVTYVDNSNNSVNVPITISYSPVTYNVNGDIHVPFTVNFSPSFNFSTKGTINVTTGDIHFDFSDRNYFEPPTGLPTGGDFEPDSNLPPNPLPDPSGTPTPIPDTDPSTTIRVIRAAIVTVNQLPPNLSRVFQGDNPDIYIPRLGNIQFLCKFNSASAWTDAIEVRNQRQVIPCPWEGGAVNVRGTPVAGVSWTITPVYAKFEPTVTYG